MPGHRTLRGGLRYRQSPRSSSPARSHPRVSCLPRTCRGRELHSVAGGMPHGNLWGRRLCRVLTAGYCGVWKRELPAERKETSTARRVAMQRQQCKTPALARSTNGWTEDSRGNPGPSADTGRRTSGTQKATPSMGPPEEAYSTISASICSFSRTMMADRTSFTCTRRTRRASPQAGRATASLSNYPPAYPLPRKKTGTRCTHPLEGTRTLHSRRLPACCDSPNHSTVVPLARSPARPLARGF
jgi:hypothetical protein